MNRLPDLPGERAGLPEKRLSNRDFEMVIRRAAELQARESEGFGDEGISEAEVLRIGRELGLSTEHLHRALAETKGSSVQQTGVMDRLFGSDVVRVARAVAGEADNVSRLLERYFVEREYLAVQRRFPERVLFMRATGVAAAMGRATSQIFSRSPLLPVANLEMAVHPFDEGFAFVSLATALSGQRTAAAASSIVGGGTGAAVSGAALGLLVAPPAALVALPLLGLSIYGARAYYEGAVRKVQIQLESVLDRLEHGELPPPARGWAGPRRL